MARKKVTALKVPRAGNWVAYDVIERGEAIKDFVEYAKRIARDKEAARSVGYRAGIITKTGRLRKRYKA
ncbi:MAG: hypothetical protein ACJ8R9_22050 [Steroidobacteraceae bacterium]